MKNTLICATFMVAVNSSALAFELTGLGANIEPSAINNAVVVVGSIHADLYPATLFRWSSTTGFELIDGSSANAVNESGQIAGSTVYGAFVLDGISVIDWNGCGAVGIKQPGAVAVYAMADKPCRPTVPLKNWMPTNSIDTSQSIAF
jgi:hypothetical protein